MAERSIFADALWWDSRNVHVRCPCCSKIHRHSFSGDYDLGKSRRTAHCDIRTLSVGFYYSFNFPFSGEYGAAAYEIDKINKRYIALGVEVEQSEYDDLEKGLADLYLGEEGKKIRSLEKWEDADEEITINSNDEVPAQTAEVDETFKVKRIDLVLGNMLYSGDVDYVRKYIDVSPNAQIFLRGISRNGRSALLLAAAKEYSAMVKLLLERGSDVDFRRRKDGRTPLMEAALWGRYENVKHLVEHGAKKHIKDNHGFTAVDLAKPSERNEEERYERAGGEDAIHHEIAFTANRARKMIVSLLEEAGDKIRILHSKDNFDRYVFRESSPGTIELLGPIAEYRLPYLGETIARLERGNSYHPIAAMSGYTHNEGNGVLSGIHWTSMAQDLAKAAGHALKIEEAYDRGIPGNFYACHAEKQLMAYLVNKHVFLESEIKPREVRRVKAVQRYVDDNGLERTLKLETEDEEIPAGQLHDLAAVMPPVMLKKATILVSSAPCPDCTEFKNLLNRKLGLDISLKFC
ncbi:MAG: hypothetical protein Q9160_007844 [Pyrenula sp. 1 TL-2023]